MFYFLVQDKPWRFFQPRQSLGLDDFIPKLSLRWQLKLGVATLLQSHQLLEHARKLFEGRHNEELKGFLGFSWWLHWNSLESSFNMSNYWNNYIVVILQ